MVELLVIKGKVNINISDKRGWSPLMVAVY